MSRRAPPKFTVEKRSVKPSGRPLDTTVRSTLKQEHAEWKAQQQQRTPVDPKKISEVAAIIEEMRRAHNDPDAMRVYGETISNVRQSEKVMERMEPWGNGIMVHAKPGCFEQLKLRMGMTYSMVPMEAPDKRLPKMPIGLRPFIKNMGKGEK
jgi:hypothetical protein